MSRTAKVQSIAQTPEPSLQQRLDKALKLASGGASLMPEPTPPPAKSEEEIPQLTELITDGAQRLRLIRLLNEQLPWQAQEKAAKAARKPLTTAIKDILGRFSVGKAAWDGYIINYYGSKPRRTVDEAKLRVALSVAGIIPSQVATILAACVSEGESALTLKITAEGDSDDE